MLSCKNVKCAYSAGRESRCPFDEDVGAAVAAVGVSGKGFCFLRRSDTVNFELNGMSATLEIPEVAQRLVCMALVHRKCFLTGSCVQGSMMLEDDAAMDFLHRHLLQIGRHI